MKGKGKRRDHTEEAKGKAGGKTRGRYGWRQGQGKRRDAMQEKLKTGRAGAGKRKKLQEAGIGEGKARFRKKEEEDVAY